VKAVAAKPAGDFKMGGAQSKDHRRNPHPHDRQDGQGEIRLHSFKSGAEAAVQLAGGHIDAHVNNPSESIGQWKGSTQRPLCAFSPQRLPDGPKVTATQNWHDIPTCVESGLAISANSSNPARSGCRERWTADQATFYIDLMKKVQAHAGMEGISSGPRRPIPS